MATLIRVERRKDSCVDGVWQFDCSHVKRYFAGTAFLARIDIVLPTLNICPDCLEKIIAGVPMESLGITREMLMAEPKPVELLPYEENLRLSEEDEALMALNEPPIDPDAYRCPF